MDRRFPFLAVVEGRFQAADCARVRSLAPALGAGQVVRAASDVAQGVRDSAVSFLDRGPDTGWLFDRVDDAAYEANVRYWGFDIQPIDLLQVARYAPGQHYDWHADMGLSGPTSFRKLSLSVQISPPDAYQGGALEVLDQGTARAAPRTEGAICLFPSYAVHRVAPVTAGERWSLVGWFKGREPFR